ncbi:MAG: adenylosuccinate lyase [Xanthomonadales bacterium]|nr:adenylosuccinate lyase [Xanthomonadales bacterium]
MSEHSPLTALSPVDGRYDRHTRALSPYLSEFGLIRHRLIVEIEWFRTLAGRPGLPEFPALDQDSLVWLDALVAGFDETQAARIKAIESTTNHDVKAVEYYLAERFREREALSGLTGFIHFACTSEDINNVSYALMLRSARDDVLLPELRELRGNLASLAAALADTAMMSRTHGQPASPTTMGKELANFVARLDRQMTTIAALSLPAKINGAVGNYNAHVVACPEVDWLQISREFIVSLGLEPNLVTTQIEPHDGFAELFHALARLNRVLVDLCRDIWGYISLGYFKQKAVDGEVGSSTMPHKVNPIDFENAEGNLGTANALLLQLADKLPVSRWQRDLSDSTAQRTIGTAWAHALIAYRSVIRGLGKLEASPEQMAGDLDEAWELLAEPVQTVMRRYGIENPYEQLKAMTRGRPITGEQLRDFVKTLDIPDEARQQLLALKPSAYIGLAGVLARMAVKDGSS